MSDPTGVADAMKSVLIERFAREVWDHASPEAKRAFADHFLNTAREHGWGFRLDALWCAVAPKEVLDELSRKVGERIRSLHDAEVHRAAEFYGRIAIDAGARRQT